MRVGIGVGGATVGGPAGVTDAGGRLRQRIGADQALEIGQLAGLLAYFEGTISDDGDAGRVVSAVLEAAKTCDHDLEGLLLADITHDSAHTQTLFGRGLLLGKPDGRGV